MSSNDEWEPFRHFAERGPAEALCAQLAAADVPARVETRRLENALEARFCVMVASFLAHRARWGVAQLPPSEQELLFLATGELPGAE